MGDVLHNVAEGCKLIFALGAVHAVIDSDKPDAMLGKKLVRVKPHLQIVAAQPGHILDHHGTDVPVLDGLDHFGKAGAIEISTAITVVPVGLDLRPAVEHYEFGKQFILILDADGFISGDIVFCLGGVGGVVHAQSAVDADLI